MANLAVKFDSPAKLGVGWITPGAGPNASNPTVDADGLRIDTHGKSAANAGGAWSVAFPTRFGEHSHFSVRWRFRVNEAWLTRFLQPGGVPVDGGAKIAIISDARGTSVENKLVIEVNEIADALKRFIVAYGYSGGVTKGYQAEGGGSERYQNARDDAGQRCRFNLGDAYDISGCACVTANDWLDFLVDVETLGRRPELPTHWDQRLKVSVGYNGGPRSLLIDYHEGTPGYVARGAGDPAMDYRFDSWTATNYVTGKDETVDHPVAQAWYDDLEVKNLKGNPVSVSLYVPKGTTVAVIPGDPPSPVPTPPPVTGAWVTRGHDFDPLVLAADRVCRWGADTRFVQFKLAAGTYTIAPEGAIAPGGKPVTNPIPVPDPASGARKQLDTWEGDAPPPVKAPGPVSPPPVTTPPPPATSGHADNPAWRKNAKVGQILPIAGTERLSGAITDERASSIADKWNGWAYIPGLGPCFVGASGHGVPINPLVDINLFTDAPRWTVLDPGSPDSAVSFARSYKDGRRCSAHRYASSHPVLPAHADDGLLRLLNITVYATYGTDFQAQGAYLGGPQVDGYIVNSRQWEREDAWPSCPIPVSGAAHPYAVCRDGRNGGLFAATSYSLARLDPKTRTWAPPWFLEVDPNGVRSPLDTWQYMPCLVDENRSCVVALIDGRPYNTAKGLRLQRVNVDTHAVADVAITGDLPAGDLLTGGCMVHDLDSDRYWFFSALGRAYIINPDSGASVKLLDFAKPVYSLETRCSADRDLGGIVLMPSYESGLLFIATR